MSTDTSSSHLVIVDYQDIASSKDLSLHLERAFGGRQLSSSSSSSTSTTSTSTSSPLGIIAIRNIPNFLEAKQRFLPLAHPLARLDPEYLETHLSDSKSFYNAGWSHGKEKLGDVPDLAKASYYFNPITDTPGTEEERERYPASYPCNKWPNEEEVPQLKEFKEAARSLGKIMHEVVILLAKHIDTMAEQRVNGYTKDLLYDAMRETEKAKGRLLYYYPLEQNKKENDNDTAAKEDNWIGWHNDSGFLTSLAGDLYIDDTTGQPLPPSQIDPEAGLYVQNRTGESIHVTIPKDCLAVQNRTGESIHVTIPKDCLAVQIGECVQILTGGVVVATPHCVRGPRAGWNPDSSTKVARISHPCFIDSKPTFPLCLPEGCSRKDVVGETGKVPPLGERWVEDGMTFGDFLQKSFEKYYDWEG